MAVAQPSSHSSDSASSLGTSICRRTFFSKKEKKKKKKKKDKIVQPSDFAEEMETQEGEVRSTVSQLISCTCGGAWVRVCVHERVCSVCTCVRAGKGQGG